MIDEDYGYSRCCGWRKPEPTYTLAEARLELIRRECATQGHDWQILSKAGGGPYALLCRCGERRAVTA